MTRKTTFKCHNCGHSFPWAVAIMQETKGRGDTRHICPSCATIKSKTAKNTDTAHTSKEHGFFMTFKMQGIPHTETAYNSMINEVYNWIPKKSGKGEAVQFDSPIYKSGNGLKKVFRTFSEYCDFSADGLAQPVTIGNYLYFTDEVTDAIKENFSILFGQLFDAMAADKEATKKVFGRFYQHNGTNWIKLENGTITLTLAKFANSNQYYQLSEMGREFINCIVKNWIEYGMTDKKAKITAGKLARIFEKYANGGAHCQRESRNSKAA